MTKEIKILGLGGSLSQPSNSLTALEIALEGAHQAGAGVEAVNFGDLNLPFFVPNQAAATYPQAATINALLEKIKAADGYIFCAPIYHGTLGGLWKNGIDFLELLPRRPKLYLDGKVVGLIAVGGGQIAAPNGITALYHVARALRAWVAPISVPVWPAKRLFDVQGKLQDQKMVEQLQTVGQQVVEFVRMQQNMISD